MKGRAFFWATALLLLMPMLAIAGKQADAVVLQQLQQRIAQTQMLRGTFQQEKQVQGFKNPLRSTGKFLIARSHGVVWTTQKPFPSELAITRDRILNRAADGSQQVEADARQQPGLRQVNALMFALMSGDVKALSNYFDPQPTLLAGNSWRLVLRPKANAMRKLFTQITLEGDRYVRQVNIEEHSGDRTTLQFSELSETPAQLSAEEMRRFD